MKNLVPRFSGITRRINSGDGERSSVKSDKATYIFAVRLEDDQLYLSRIKGGSMVELMMLARTDHELSTS